jgi:hypothetical protein
VPGFRKKIYSQKIILIIISSNACEAKGEKEAATVI